MSTPARAASLELFFEDPHNYLDRRGYEIRLRREVVGEIVGYTQYNEILDIGCGDGSISLPLLTSTNHLTLLEVCGNMLALAESKVPVPLAERVTALHANAMTAPFIPRSYDLILCLGVLAHVESPIQLIGRIASALRRDGTLVLQFTDSQHFLGRAATMYRRLCDVIRPPAYPLSLLTAPALLAMAASRGLALVRTYRYSSAPPGAHRVLSQRILYRVIRALHGTVAQNRCAWLGSEYICEFRLSSLPLSCLLPAKVGCQDTAELPHILTSQYMAGTRCGDRMLYF